jgi:hypothetical protein
MSEKDNDFPVSSTTSPIRALLSAAAVRERAHEMLELALEGRVEGWRVDLAKLDAAAELTAQVTRDNYPDLAIPFHARFRHFVAGPPRLPDGGEERARAAFDLVILSVLLDAGSGPGWRYRDAGSGATYARSEGLAVASQRMFEAGALADLCNLETAAVAEGFQVSPDNPIAGLEGRAGLLRRLGARVAARPDLFPGGRPGGLYDVLAARAEGGRLPAPAILDLLLEALGPIWADRLTIEGVPLGDCWRHPALRRGDATDGLVPLHKLSQWLSYSLIEPLQEAGVEVVEIDGLTGLAEYRNGGLFVDTSVSSSPIRGQCAERGTTCLRSAHRGPGARLPCAPRPPGATGARALGVSEAAFPSPACWRAALGGGRRIAAERRAGGGPPFTIISDGTVF